MIDQYGRQILTYDELTLKQKEFFLKYVWNGVGSRSYPKPPQLIFKEASILHDYRYFAGGNEKDRKNADREFFHKAHSAVRKQYILKRPFYYVMSYVYFYTLKKIGGKAWEYYPAPAKNWDEYLKRVYSFFDCNPNMKDRPPAFQD